MRAISALWRASPGYNTAKSATGHVSVLRAVGALKVDISNWDTTARVAALRTQSDQSWNTSAHSGCLRLSAFT